MDKKPLVITIENIRPFDIDRCMIKEYEGDIGDNSNPTVEVEDPLTGSFIEVMVNKAMVRLLKEEKHRGGYILVWSRSGWEWARNVIQALELEKYVDQIMSKPVVYFDDTPIQDWLKDRVFLDFDFKYKE